MIVVLICDFIYLKIKINVFEIGKPRTCIDSKIDYDMVWGIIVSFNYLSLLFQCFTFDHFSNIMSSDTTEIIEYFYF